MNTVNQVPLKDATAEKHKMAERMPFNVRMFKGELSKADYLLYLHQQYAIFKAIEDKGVPHISLNRCTPVLADIAEIEAEGIKNAEILSSTKKYATHLENLNPETVLPHVYLNYLAIVFGGQMIRKKVPSAGKMYDFDNMHEAVASIRAVQKDEWADEANSGFDFLIEIFRELQDKTAPSA
ncbi:MAG: biliverdin-producing heme oxygenase [Bacteroidia bacterium]|nr:biliverdin-producing heme oxygenase [Bacteroidia bacterium]